MAKKKETKKDSKPIAGQVNTAGFQPQVSSTPTVQAAITTDAATGPKGIDTTNLTPRQITRINYVKKHKGYTDKQLKALANSFRKKNAKGGPDAGSDEITETPEDTAPPPVSQNLYDVDPNNLGVKSDGTINTKTASGEIKEESLQDIFRTILSQNPSAETDQFGNKTELTIGPNGELTRTSTAGAPLTQTTQAFQTALGGYNYDFGSQVQKAQDANYNYITKNYAQEKQREMDSAKQELANRGIPLDPSPNSLYGRTLQQIDQKYQSLDDQAKNQSITLGTGVLTGQTAAQNQNVSTLSNAAGTFTQNATPFQGTQSNLADQLLTLINTASDAELTKLGITKDYAAKIKQLEAQKANKPAAAPEPTGPVFNS